MGRRRTPDEGAALIPDPDLPDAVTLVVDGLAQSHVDRRDPTHLVFEYMRRLQIVVDVLDVPERTAPPAAGTPPSRVGGAATAAAAATILPPIRVAHLGGGALTMARYISATRPGSAQTVIEADAAVIALARELGVPPGVRIRHADAAREVATLRGQDLIILDAFHEGSIPADFARPRFVDAAAAALSPGGVFAVNIGDGGSLDYSRRYAAGLIERGLHVGAMADPAIFRARRFGNVVLIGSRSPFPQSEIVRRCVADPIRGRVDWGFGIGSRPHSEQDACMSPAPPDGFRG